MLYPIELQAHRLLKMVGVERFELPTHCSQSSCATRLRYTPKPVNLLMLRISLNCVNPFTPYWAIKTPINSKGHPLMDGLGKKLDPCGARRIMARPERFELPTARFVAGYSIQLSYGRAVLKLYHLSSFRRDYSGHPALHPSGSLRSCKFAPGEFVELPTARFVAGYSIQLSYGRAVCPAQLKAPRGVRIIGARHLIVNRLNLCF